MNKKNLLLPHNLFTLRLLLSLLGAYLDYRYQHKTHDIWLIMMLLFTVIAIAPDYLQYKHHAVNLKRLIHPLMHWIGGLCAVIIIYSYQRTGRLYHEEGDLVVLVVLALTVYLEGIQTGWRGIITGLFLGLTAVCVAYFDSYVWQLGLLAIVAIAVSYYSGSEEVS
ncbi:MAG: hypothetical protein RIR39_515 [Pseudomonadota bacterium]|jgi:hypothetical protein